MLCSINVNGLITFDYDYINKHVKGQKYFKSFIVAAI